MKKTEDRRQKTEDRKQKTENRKQKAFTLDGYDEQRTVNRLPDKQLNIKQKRPSASIAKSPLISL